MAKGMAAETEKSFPPVGIGASAGESQPSSPFSSGMFADAADLRKQAEALAAQNAAQSSEQLAPLSPEATKLTLHELRVHQIELEMQNEDLRRAQAELDATRARYFDLYDLAPVGYVTISEKGLFLEANLTAASLLGVGRNTLVLQPIWQFVLKEYQHIYYQHIKELFETKTRQVCELRMVKKDGTIFWARMEATIAQNSNGTPVCRAVISDISEIKQSEALQQRALASEQLHQNLVALNNCPNFDSALACLVQSVIESGNMDSAGIYLIEGQNAVLRPHTGLTPAFIEKVSCCPLSTSYMKDALQDPYKIVTISSEHYHLDGAYGIRHGYCIALVVGDQPIGFLNVGSSHVEPPSASNIEIIRILALETGSVFLRLKVEDRLQKVNAEQRVILETTPVGIVHLKDRKVQWANPAFGRILGYTDEESVGLDSTSFYVSREESERVDSAAYEQSSQGKVYSAEVEMKRKDSSLFWASIVSMSVDPKNQAEGAIWKVHDITERKQAEEALRSSEARFRNILDACPVPLALNDEAGNITYLNPQFTQSFGYCVEEIPHLALWWSKAYPDASYRNWVESEWRQRLETARGEQAPFKALELSIRCRDGSSRTVIAQAASLSGNFAANHLVSLYDITERKRMEEALSENRELFSLFMRHSPNYAFIKEVTPTESRVIQASDSFQQMVGLSRLDMLGKTMSELFPPEVAAKMTADDWAVVAKGEVLNVDEDFNGRNYTTIKYPIVQRGKTLLAGYTIDITERKRAEEALLESRELFSLFMRHSPIYAFIKEVTPTDSCIIQVSDNFKQITGISALDMQGKTMSEMFPSEVAAKMIADDFEIVAKGNVMKVDEAYNGRNYTTIKYPAVLRGKTLLAGYTIDITESKRAEEAKEKLEFQNRQLHKSESLGRMAGAIAHHFNNQLHVVLMNLQMAMQTLPQNAEPVENLIEAMKSARKAADVSTLMLTYLGQTAAKHEPLYLCDACQRHLPMLRTVMPQSVVLETDLPSPSPVVNANANQIQQILTNLITNAWEAMGETRGVIRLTVKTVPSSEIPTVNRFPIDCQVQDQPYACLEVADTGCGIADKDIEKVFDPFFSTKFAGRGLGLSVVLGIVRAHDGCVTVESRPGKGSVFRVFLPLSSEAISQKSAIVAQGPNAAGGGTVLVVDDEPPLRKAVLLALKRSGFTVLEAKDGVEGVEVFQQHRDEIGCVLCDMTMPGMNGWETLTALRKLVPDIPVILASGYSREQVMAGDHPELPQAFLSKPYELANLKDTIVRLMRKPDQTVKKT